MSQSDNANIKNKVVSGLFWKIMENGGTQGIQFIVSIILARILTPTEYGIIALINVFIAIANVFIQSGFNTALIQKKHADERDFSSVFYLNLSMAAVLYLILYAAAPFIADFYDDPMLSPVLRVLSLALIPGAASAIQSAVITRTMQFKKLFISSLMAVILSGVLGIVMAYSGYGVWALVGQQLAYHTFLCIVLAITVSWKPKLLFSLSRVKVLFDFGWKILISSLLNTVYNKIYNLTIGKIYDSGILAYYDKADQFPQVIANNVNNAIQSVLLPAMSANQNDKRIVKDMVRRSIKVGSFLVFPMMIGLAAVAEPMVSVVLTDKWLPCVPYLRIICFSYAFWPVHTANLQAINAMGRSDLYLKLEVIKKVVGVIALLISIPFGVMVMVLFQPIVSVIGMFINAWPNKQLLNYSFNEQWKDIFPTFVMALIMGGIVYGVQLLPLGNLLTLIIQIIIGVLVYALLARVSKNDSFYYILDILKSFRKKGAGNKDE